MTSDFKSDSESVPQILRRSLVDRRKGIADAYHLERVVEHDLAGLFTKVEIGPRVIYPKAL